MSVVDFVPLKLNSHRLPRKNGKPLVNFALSMLSNARIDETVVSGRHESIVAALEFQRLAWFRGARLNYSLDQPTPRTRDLKTVTVDQFKRRDIDTVEEFALAEAILLQGRG